MSSMYPIKKRNLSQFVHYFDFSNRSYLVLVIIERCLYWQLFYNHCPRNHLIYSWVFKKVLNSSSQESFKVIMHCFRIQIFGLQYCILDSLSQKYSLEKLRYSFPSNFAIYSKKLKGFRSVSMSFSWKVKLSAMVFLSSTKLMILLRKILNFSIKSSLQPQQISGYLVAHLTYSSYTGEYLNIFKKWLKFIRYLLAYSLKKTDAFWLDILMSISLRKSFHLDRLTELFSSTSIRAKALTNVNLRFFDRKDWIRMVILLKMSPRCLSLRISSAQPVLEAWICIWDCICTLQMGIMPSICLFASLMYFQFLECNLINLSSQVMFSCCLSYSSICVLLIVPKDSKLEYFWSVVSFGPTLIYAIEISEEQLQMSFDIFFLCLSSRLLSFPPFAASRVVSWSLVRNICMTLALSRKALKSWMQSLSLALCLLTSRMMRRALYSSKTCCLVSQCRKYSQRVEVSIQPLLKKSTSLNHFQRPISEMQFISSSQSQSSLSKREQNLSTAPSSMEATVLQRLRLCLLM